MTLIADVELPLAVSAHETGAEKSTQGTKEEEDGMSRCRRSSVWEIVWRMTWALLALTVQTWAQREPATGAVIEGSLEAVEGRLVLAVSASPGRLETQREPIPLQVRVFLEGETSGLSEIGTGTLFILPGTSRRLPLVIEEPGGEVPVRATPSTSSLLTIHLGGKLVLYRQGPLTGTDRPAIETALRLERRAPRIPLFKEARTKAVDAPSDPLQGTDVSNGRADSTAVSLVMRLLAAETEEEAGQLVVEVAAPDLSGEAVFEIVWQGRRRQQRLRLGVSSSLRLPLPSSEGPLSGLSGEDGSTDPHPIRYTLRSAQGDLLLSGEVSLVALMEREEAVLGEVGPFQFDRTEYQPGESLRLWVVIRGGASAGYRLVIDGRGEDGRHFYRTEMEVSGSSEPLPLVISLPASLRGPAILEYQLLDRQTGFLYQNGQQPIPLRP